jgi:threonine/homoserine/homoserine lactone efflux protein
LATQRTLRGERHATAKVIAGTATGIYCHATLAAVGLSAIVMRSSEIFTMVRVLGAAYRITLGAAMLWRARLGLRHEDPATARPVGRAAGPGSTRHLVGSCPRIGDDPCRRNGAVAHVLVRGPRPRTTVDTTPTVPDAVDRTGGAVLVGFGLRTAVA